ncbi:MAG TPA: CpsB/CapC family capsule biosynthesis tyrosine phosphatase [Ferruginibacter sp.]|jgi:protein-tyrosine phosphatase|nr:CpsB/CapC family capsule biosynthesis tyrosine phosphatase [Ferruginibacter sp.]
MFSFFKQKKNNVDLPEYLPIQTDMHSHILPGIDDGSPDIKTSLKLVKGLTDLGIKKAIATPHIMGDMYRNNRETITRALEELKIACQEAQIKIELNAAAEYMLDDHFMNILRSRDPLLTIHKNVILTEQSYAVKTENLLEIAYEINMVGYKPIMAHPERYFFYYKNYDDYFQLKELGFLLQVNLLSLIGHYGNEAEKAAKFIIKENLADLVGTDMHHMGHLTLLQKKENLEILHRNLEGRTYNLLDDLVL